MDSTVQLDSDAFDVMATHLRNGKNFFRKLGFFNGEIETTLLNHPNDYWEFKYQLLLSWKQRHDKDATLGKLVEYLYEHENYECIERLRKVYESRKKPNEQ